MAQDLLIMPLDAGDAGFDRKIVTDILSRGACAPVVDFSVSYPDGSGGEANGIDDEIDQVTIDHLGFVHFGGRTMMERIFELADALEAILAWSDAGEGEPCACVTRAEYLDRMADDFKALDPVVVRDASHLNEIVKGMAFE